MKKSLTLLLALLASFSLFAQVGTDIATTWYGLQTNASAGDRIVNLGDGHLIMSWTHGGQGNGFPNRGSGFAELQNGEWDIFTQSDLPVAIETASLGAYRCGWPSIGETSAGRTIIMSHHFPSANTIDKNGLVYNFKDEGDTEWTTAWFHDMENVDFNTDAIWTRMSISGMDVHLINGQWEIPWNGVSGGLQYHRSLDGGDSFESIPLPDMDISQTGVITGDSYAIHSNGDIVAIIANELNPMLWKSSDRGATWTTTRIIETSNPSYDPDNTTHDYDPIISSDGSMDVLIADDGVVHVFMARSMNIDSDPGDGGWSFYTPTRMGIMYWNDQTAGLALTLGKTVIKDEDGDLFPTYESDRQYLVGQSTHPRAGKDADGNIYLVFGQTVDGDLDEEGIPYRDVFAIKSTDGGASWVGPVNLTDSPGSESYYGFIAREVDENLHMIYQNDEFTGEPVYNSQTEVAGNNIKYMSFPVADIVDPPAGAHNTVPLYFTPYDLGEEQSLWANCPLVDQYIEGWTLTAVDYPDGDILELISTSTAEFDIAGTFEISLSIQDSDGNLAHRINIVDEDPGYILEEAGLIETTVEIFVDDEVPEVIVNGDTEWELLLNGAIEIPPFTITDNSDGLGCPISTWEIQNMPDTSLPGIYEILIVATDFTGNEGVAVLTVTVGTVDESFPEITLTDPFTGLAIEGGEYTVEGGAGLQFFPDWAPILTPEDNITDLQSSDVSTAGFVDMTVVGDYEVSYTVSDDAGNETVVTIIVHVVDTVQPIILSPLNGQTISVECGNVGFQSLAELSTQDGFSTEYLIFGDPVNVDIDCEYNVTYLAEDASGNVSPNSITVTYSVEGCDMDCNVGIDDENDLERSFVIRPNPGIGLFLIEFNIEINQKINWQVFDIAGRSILSKSTEAQEALEIDIRNQPDGIYLLEMELNGEKIKDRIVLQR